LTIPIVIILSIPKMRLWKLSFWGLPFESDHNKENIGVGYFRKEEVGDWVAGSTYKVRGPSYSRGDDFQMKERITTRFKRGPPAEIYRNHPLQPNS
jgi:hypothetical protein